MKKIPMTSGVYELTTQLRKSKAKYVKGLKVGDKIRMKLELTTLNSKYASTVVVEKLNEETNEFEFVGSDTQNNVNKILLGYSPIFEAKLID